MKPEQEVYYVSGGRLSRVLAVEQNTRWKKIETIATSDGWNVWETFLGKGNVYAAFDEAKRRLIQDAIQGVADAEDALGLEKKRLEQARALDASQMRKVKR